MEEILNKILTEITGLKADVADLKTEISDLKCSVNDIQEGQVRLENKVDSIKDQLDEHDTKNANRHIELQNDITSLRKDISTMEVVTASNYVDIAKLKAVK